MYINGRYCKCDFHEDPDNGLSPIKCSPEHCGGYTPTPMEVKGVLEEIYKVIEQNTGKKKLFDTIEELNAFYKST